LEQLTYRLSFADILNVSEEKFLKIEFF